MPNRDALWVRPDGTTTVVELDEAGNLVMPADPPPQAVPASPDPPRKPGRPRKQR